MRWNSVYVTGMAVPAAQAALTASGLSAADFGLLLHASFYHQGLDCWAPASYVLRHTIGRTAPAMEVSQASNGGLAALELAAAYLTAVPARPAALITAADRFCLPGFDRFRTSYGIVFADGAAAVVLSRQPGLAKLVSSSHVSIPELEEPLRGTEGFTTHSLATGMPLDVRQRNVAYLSSLGLERVVDSMTEATRGAVAAALDEAGIKISDIALTIVPNIGLSALKWQFLDGLGVDEAKTTVAWGRRIGHLGAGDHLAALDHLVRTEALHSGDQVLLASTGIGFTWSASVLQMV